MKKIELGVYASPPNMSLKSDFEKVTMTRKVISGKSLILTWLASEVNLLMDHMVIPLMEFLE